MTPTKQPPFVVSGESVRDRATDTVIGYVFGEPRRWHYAAAPGVTITLSPIERDNNGWSHSKRGAAETLWRAWTRTEAAR